MTDRFLMHAGTPNPMGATIAEGGVNFSVFSDHAERMTLCLFSEDGKAEIARLNLPEREGGIWYGFVEGVKPGQIYGYRADGPYRPEDGHRFNANKLLIDPYARKLTQSPAWSPHLLGFKMRHPDKDLSFDRNDSAPHVAKSIVAPLPSPVDEAARPKIAVDKMIIYEAHVKGLTKLWPGIDQAGTYTALSSDPVLDHLLDLGITSIELLPNQAFVNDAFLVRRKLRNYWGYQTLCFLAPEPRYATDDSLTEFRAMVDRFHQAGIEVLMDVVYNHTCEGNEIGPTMSFRGLDNSSYYRLAENKRFYINDTGTGNTFNIDHPMVLRLVLDSLRYWVEVMGVDGFRFDLCSTLGRTPDGFDRNSAFFKSVRQDPVLSRVKLIAEPWDIGPGGYQLGAYPPSFQEWNDKFRDGVRRFWRGDKDLARDFTQRIAGSALQFDHSDRLATSSVNLITAHDGFTLQDVVSYNTRHNEANQEGGRDGHGENFSDNMGVEGPSSNPAIVKARALRKRNLMASLLLAQGTPMILGGDEIGNSQTGNNNAYCQDNETGWVDWTQADWDFQTFTKRLIQFRKMNPVLSQKKFLHGTITGDHETPDIAWYRSNGAVMNATDWDDPDLAMICVLIRKSQETSSTFPLPDPVFLIFNRGERQIVTLPNPDDEMGWFLEVNTAEPNQNPAVTDIDTIAVTSNSVCALRMGRKLVDNS